MIAINSKKKGNHFENVWANWLMDNGIKAYKDSASGAGIREKADVGNNLNIHFEVKAVAGINLKKVWAKAEYECEKTHNQPVIAIHFNGFPEDKFLMVMDNYYFLELLSGGKIIPEMDSKNKWKVSRLVEAAKEVLKIYNA